MNWCEASLSELVTLRSGGTPSKQKPEYWNGSVPWVSCKDMKTLRLHDSEDHVTEAALGNGTRLVPAGTVLIVVRGMILAKEFPISVIQKPAAFNQDLKAVVPHENLDPAYLVYLLLGHRWDLRALADEAAHGTKRIQTDRLLSYRVRLPPLPTQRRIASILSAYDDLIENNTRRIAILEDMTRRLYEEWFVRFRFPGHEGTTFADTELGRVPKRWEVMPLLDVSSFVGRGIAPKYDPEAGCRVINQKCIRDQRLNMDLARRQSKQVPGDKVVRLGDVLINSTGVGTLGRVAQVQDALEGVTVDSHVTIVRPSETVDSAYLGQQLLRMQSHFEDQGVGATGQTELSRSRVAETLLLIPPTELQQRFGNVVRPMKSYERLLAEQKNNLRAQRDLLLPKLVSGEIDVSEAALPTQEMAAE